MLLNLCAHTAAFMRLYFKKNNDLMLKFYYLKSLLLSMKCQQNKQYQSTYFTANDNKISGFQWKNPVNSSHSIERKKHHSEMFTLHACVAVYVICLDHWALYFVFSYNETSKCTLYGSSYYYYVSSMKCF